MRKLFRLKDDNGKENPVMVILFLFGFSGSFIAALYTGKWILEWLQL